MSYAVFTRDAAGDTVVEDVDSLEAAVATVERLRNEDEAADVRVFREVPLQVRTYYKVVVAEGEADDGPAPDVVAAPSAATVDHADELAAVQAATAAVPVDARADEQEPVESPVARVSSLPGAFPLAAPTPSPQVEVHDADLDTAAEHSRRHSLFSRGG